MNLEVFRVAIRKKNVRENFRRIADAIGFTPEDLVFFGSDAYDLHPCGDRSRPRQRIYKTAGLYGCGRIDHRRSGLVLATFYADCVPLYFVDPIRKAVGLSHSGWRGTVHKIGKITVQAMADQYGSRPEDIVAIIGPSICQDCYEVSEDVILEFQKYYREDCQSELYYRKENGKYQLNLWRAKMRL